MPNVHRAIIIRMARGNYNWGIRRILSEFKELALRVSRTSLRTVFKEKNLHPDPYRHAQKVVWTAWQNIIERLFTS